MHIRLLEAELEADFEAREIHLEGGGAGGVGIVVGGEAGEAVAEVETDSIVGETGGDTEVDLVVVLILRVVDGYIAVFGVGYFVVFDFVVIPAIGDIGTEVPMDTFAEDTARNETHALEEFNAQFVEVVVFVLDIVAGEVKEVVETDAFVGVEAVAGVAVVKAETDAVGFAEGTHETETDVGGRRPAVDFVLLRAEAYHVAELQIEITTQFGTVAE